MPSDLISELVRAGIVILVSIGLYQLAYFFIKRWATKKDYLVPKLIRDHFYYPGLAFVIIAVLTFTFPLFKKELPDGIYSGVNHLLKILTILTLGFTTIQLFTVVKEMAYHHYSKESRGQLQFRKVETKFQIIQRVLNSVIILVTTATVLTTFPGIRSVGNTLLASAGVVGIILGFAAQKSLGTFFAGLQIAIAQPIRIGDTVIVKEEFGTIGEINLTFVIVNIWDGRRLVVPINYFLEETFESWTRVSPEVVAKVKINTDYSVPIQDIREKFNKWLEASDKWDKRSSGFVVTNSNERTIELRATMSAKDADDAWDLQCYMREKLITYIQENYPESLPKNRVLLYNNQLMTN